MRDEKYIADLTKKLLRKYPYFGSTINNLEFKVVSKESGVKTACTNGKQVLICDEFLDTLNDEKKELFLAAHEVAHVALKHIERQKGKVHRTWNIACDAVINKYLEKDDLPIIEGGINITDALNYDAEELYFKLLEKQKQNKKNNKKNQDKNGQQQDNNDQQDQDQGDGQSQGQSSDEFDPGDMDDENEDCGHASHSRWGELEKENEEQNEDENENGSSGSSGDKEDEEEKDKEENSSGNGKDDKDEENEKDNDKKEPISEREEFEKNKQQRIKMAKDIMKKINHNKDRGLDGAGEEAVVGDVGEASTPVTNWKRVLARTFEVEDEVWGHRFSDKGNNWAARIEDVELDDDAETEIVVDTSGSISYSLLRAFLKQTKTVLRVSKVKVGAFNNDFYGFQELKSEKDIDELKLNIGGGTNFDAASRAFSHDRYINKICFTDGQDGGNAGIREKRDDILWISFENPNFKPDNGKVLFVPPELIECFEQSTPDNSADDDLTM